MEINLKWCFKLILSNYYDWDLIKQLAFILWIVVILILVVGIILSRIHYKQSKSYFSLGLIMLCIGFIIGRIFRLIVSFYIGDPPIGTYNNEALILMNVIFWISICLIFTLGFISFFKKKIKGKSFYVYWIILTSASMLIIYLIMFLIELNVGKLPKLKPFEGNTLIYETISVIGSWMGYLILIFCVEKVSIDLFNINKTKYLFTIVTGIALVVTIIENFTGSVTYALLVFFIVSMAGLGLIFFYMATISTGEIRRNSLCVCVGHIFLVLSFAFDIPSGFLIFGVFSGPLLFILSPIFHTIGLIFYVRGLVPIIIRIRK